MDRQGPVAREIEDIDAMIKAAGGWAFLFGVSSGAALALAAARSGLAVRRLGMYEAPFIVDDLRPPVSDEFLAHVDALVTANRRSLRLLLIDHTPFHHERDLCHLLDVGERIPGHGNQICRLARLNATDFLFHVEQPRCLQR
jgi:hypothetical protein